MKTVQICLATYNGGAFISSFLDSLVNQDLKDFEVLVSDDGSIDNTLDIIRSYEDRLNIVFYMNDSSKPMGSAQNFMGLLKVSSADYVLLADQDDVWKSGKVRKCLALMANAESKNLTAPMFVFSDYCLVDEDLCIIERSGLSKVTTHFSVNTLIQSLDYTNFIPGCTVVVNRRLVDLAVNLECNGEILMHDWWLALIAKYNGGIFLFIREPLVMYRQHLNNVVGVSAKISVATKIFSFLRFPREKLTQLEKQFKMAVNAGRKKSFLNFLMFRFFRGVWFE